MDLTRDLIPPPKGPRMEFLCPKHREPRPYLVISTWVWGHYVHWTGRFTIECTLKLGHDGQPVTKCDGCAAELPRKARGYLHVLPEFDTTQVFLVLPPGCFADLEEHYGREKNLRGLTFEFWRSTKNPRSELVARLKPHRDRKVLTIEEADPGPYLDVLFRRNARLKSK